LISLGNVLNELIGDFSLDRPSGSVLDNDHLTPEHTLQILDAKFKGLKVGEILHDRGFQQDEQAA
jgi:hypothetical protein